MSTQVSAVNKINKKDIYAKYAENDALGRRIDTTYATKAEVGSAVSVINHEISSTSATLNEKIVSGINSLSATVQQEFNTVYTEINDISASVSSIIDNTIVDIVDMSGNSYVNETKVAVIPVLRMRPGDGTNELKFYR